MCAVPRYAGSAAGVPGDGPEGAVPCRSKEHATQVHRVFCAAFGEQYVSRRSSQFHAHGLGVVPVARAADNATSGTGRISISEEDTRLVVGHGTRFLSEFKPRSQVLLPKAFGSCTAEVLEVLSDDRLRIKAEFATDEGTTTQQILDGLAELRANGTEGTDFKRIPHVNQGETFQHVYTCLNEGGCIVIFPEG